MTTAAISRLLPQLLLLLLLTSLPGPAASLPLQDQAAAQEAPPGTTIKLPAGYTTTLFSDDFSALAAGAPPSPAKWTTDLGTGYPGGPAHWGTNEVQTYTRARANLAGTGSALAITPVLGAGGAWTSARIETSAAHDVACAAGRRLRLEAALRVGAGAGQAGIWHAFWALGAAYRGRFDNWPAVGEIDVFETLNGLGQAWQTVHCGSARGGPCREGDGIGSTVAVSRGVWHTVAVEIDRTNVGGDWRGETISWLVDGVVTANVTGATVGDATAWEALARSKKFLLLNTAVGGSFPDAVQRSRTPTSATRGGSDAAMEVKYVAVFST